MRVERERDRDLEKEEKQRKARKLRAPKEREDALLHLV